MERVHPEGRHHERAEVRHPYGVAVSSVPIPPRQASPPCNAVDRCRGTAVAHFHARHRLFLVGGTVCEWHLLQLLAEDERHEFRELRVWPVNETDPWLPPGAAPPEGPLPWQWARAVDKVVGQADRGGWAPADPGCDPPEPTSEFHVVRAPAAQTSGLVLTALVALGLAVLGFGLFLAVASVIDYVG